jgi:hypothetical protein
MMSISVLQADCAAPDDLDDLLGDAAWRTLFMYSVSLSIISLGVATWPRPWPSCARRARRPDSSSAW